jgi:hypothetical protein
MKRSTVIIGLVLCAMVYLFGQERTRQSGLVPTTNLPNIDQLVQASERIPVGPNPVVPRSAAQMIQKTLPSHAMRIARLEQEYRDHPGFRQLVMDFNAETGHPGRGVTASLEALDHDAIAGAPAFALFRAVQPRAEIARALDRQWGDERAQRDRDTPAP